MLPDQGHLNRSYYLGKYLKRLGHEPTVFVGSHPHNTSLQLIDGKEKFLVYQNDPYPWVLIKTKNYEGSRKKRAFAIFEFYRNMKKAVKHFECPDVIIGSSAHPLASLLAIKLSRKYNCKGIIEIRDLWPESMVAYGIASKKSFIIKLLYKFEKYLYKNADSIIFTMENAYQYILDNGLENVVPAKKVFYLNNGVDLEDFENNKSKFTVADSDLEDPDVFKIVYTGSIRHVNNVGIILDAAKKIQNPKVRFLIWGDGDQLEFLKNRVSEEHIDNVVFKGRIAKRYIPYIVSHANINFSHNQESSVFKYGISFNKLFDFLAAGKPVLFDFKAAANPAIVNNAGFVCESNSPEDIAETIDRISSFSVKEFEPFGLNARKTAEKYSFEVLAEKLISIINDTEHSERRKR